MPEPSQRSLVASSEDTHGSFALTHPHHKSDPAAVHQPESTIFRGKFRSLLEGAATSKTLLASSEAEAYPAGLPVGCDELSATGSRYVSPQKGAGSESSLSTKEINTKADADVEKWIGIAGWCRYQCAKFRPASSRHALSMTVCGCTNLVSPLIVLPRQ